MRILLLSLLIGCSPVKQVLKDKDKFDIVAEEVIRRGYCVNDTTVITKDSVVYKDSIIERKIKVPCKDFDTTFGGTRISVSSGVLTYTHTCKEKTITKTVTNTVRDRSYERILRKDIDSRDSSIQEYKKVVLNLQTANKTLSSDNVKEKFKFWVLLVSALVIIFRKPIIRMIWPFLK